ncbi:MAG: hypothetical protein KKF43_16530 [Proteobacteria bacterium]|nr:hypothetical protein [Pseudomonadota bacterium]
MRKNKEPQLNLLNLMPRNKITQELDAISQVLDANQDILDPVYSDLVKYRRQDTGRNGMTAEQVLRCAILKQYRELIYEELAFHLDDSKAFRSFAWLEMGRTVRVDSTVVESTIHHPTDSTLLADGIRVITCLREEGRSLDPAPWYTFVDHQRAAS